MTVNEDANEESALLVQRAPTPLPWSQLSIILLMQLSEPLTSQSIYPYINQLISELDITGGDEKKVGYYAGIIESLFFVTQACTVLQWSRLSDHIGRKPVLLMGLIGVCISNLCFGLSKTFWLLVVSRCICGVLNGNIGVMKSAMGELTDSSNRAAGFSLIPIMWSAGAAVAPLIGGGLSKPHERFPETFRSPFWREYPYFLPCGVVSSYVAISIIIGSVFFKETLHRRATVQARQEHQNTTELVSEDDDPVPFKALLQPSVLIPVFNYVLLSFFELGLFALQPLFFSMPIALGGLSLDPPTIGYILASFGAVNGIFQALFFAKIVGRFGPKRIFVNGMMLFIPIFGLFPVVNFIARSGAPSVIVWVILAIQICLCVIMDMAFGCIFMFITAAAPNKRSLGATNGLAQTTVSIARAIAPALTTSLFSFSVEYNILGGKFIYVVLVFLVLYALALAKRLPENGWKDK